MILMFFQFWFPLYVKVFQFFCPKVDKRNFETILLNLLYLLIYGGNPFAVAFRLYDLRQTGYIEREEVSFFFFFSNFFLLLLLLHFGFSYWMASFLYIVEWFYIHSMKLSNHKYGVEISFMILLSQLVVLFLWQLKEMVLALLHESDLVLSDDVVEAIVNKVQIDTYSIPTCRC